MTPAATVEHPARVCVKCTGVGDAHYLTCPVLSWPPAPPPPPGRLRAIVAGQPVPGTYQAAASGCICDVQANNHGRNEPPGGWHITEGCPVHAPSTTRRAS